MEINKFNLLNCYCSNPIKKYIELIIFNNKVDNKKEILQDLDNLAKIGDFKLTQDVFINTIYTHLYDIKYINAGAVNNNCGIYSILNILYNDFRFSTNQGNITINVRDFLYNVPNEIYIKRYGIIKQNIEKIKKELIGKNGNFNLPMKDDIFKIFMCVYDINIILIGKATNGFSFIFDICNYDDDTAELDYYIIINMGGGHYSSIHCDDTKPYIFNKSHLFNIGSILYNKYIELL